MLLVLGLLFLLPLIAYTSGFWESQTPEAVRMQLLQMIDYVGH